MCWRIVRVTGDGSIKLALYNYNSSSCTETGNTNAFARYSDTTYTTVFNTNAVDNAYVGLMYGNFTAPTNCTTTNGVTTCTGGSTSYAEAHANVNKSTILTNLETWYTSKLSTYSAKLADTIWCNDKSTTKDLEEKGGMPDYTVKTYSYPGLGYGTSNSYYNATNRFHGLFYNQIFDTYSNGTGVSLICPDDNDGGNLSKFTADDTKYGNGALDYKIGLLTADELALSGYSVFYHYNLTNKSYYLNTNAEDDYYWSFSPYDYFVGADVCIADSGIIDGDSVTTSAALRPSVSLVSGTTVTGSGTAADPYVVS